MIIWTRVTPAPEATPGSGKGAARQVGWSVRDVTGRVVRRGTVTTSPTSDHTARLRFGMVSCSNYTGGFFSAYCATAAGSFTVAID